MNPRARRSTGAAPIVLTLGLAAAAFAACSRDPAPAGARLLRAPLYADPTSLSLVGNTDVNSGIVARLVGDSLVDYDDSLVFRPRVAESWEVSEDGRTVVFRLRDGVRWHDGAAVTARDVVFTVNTVRDPKAQARSWIGLFQDIESVVAEGERTVVARYARRQADFLEAWRVPLIPEHIASRDADFLTGAFARHPTGCGPFRFVRAVPGSEIVLEANADYWDGAPSLPGIVFRIVPDERTAFEALLRGDLDYLALTPDLWREAKAGRDTSRLRAMRYFRLSLWYVAWNGDGSNPYFTNPHVRRAMVLALDRERFAERGLEGLGRPVATPWLPDTPWHDPSIPPWPYDPDEARRLLEAAGWSDRDGDGVRERGGRAFAFTLLVPASGQSVTTDRIAAWVKERLATIGVRAEIERLEWRAFQERRRERAFEAAMASVMFTPSPDLYDVLHSSAARGGFNYAGFSDPEVDRLLELGRIETDEEARREIYRELQRRVHEAEPIACLYQFAQVALVDRRLRGPAPSPLGVFESWPGPRGWSWEER